MQNLSDDFLAPQPPKLRSFLLKIDTDSKKNMIFSTDTLKIISKHKNLNNTMDMLR